MTDWALVVFTLLVQAGIGLFCTEQLIYGEGKIGYYSECSAVVLTGLGMAVSQFHLGKPANAHRALCNVKSSWLSREALFTGGFFVAIVIKLFLRGDANFENIAGSAAILFGICGLVSMSSVYKNTSIVFWRTNYTHIVFCTTAIILGGSGYVAVLIQAQLNNLFAIKSAAIMMAVATGVQIAGLVLYLSEAGAKNALATNLHQSCNSGYWLKVSLAFTIIGEFLFNLQLIGTDKVFANILLGALGVIIAGQITGRYWFFVSGVHQMNMLRK